MIENEEQAQAFVSERCDRTAFDRLTLLVSRLREESDRQNLVSASSLGSVWIRHIADSAQLLDCAPEEASNPWLDLGTGAGFPGMVVAIMRPKMEVHLVESRKLRVEWLRGLVQECGLDRCSVIGSRVESVETAPYSIISARAFAPLDRLLKLAKRFSTSDTRWLLPKGRSAAQEVADLPKSLRSMFHVEQSVTDPEAGIIVGHLAEGKRR